MLPSNTLRNAFQQKSTTKYLTWLNIVFYCGFNVLCSILNVSGNKMLNRSISRTLLRWLERSLNPDSSDDTTSAVSMRSQCHLLLDKPIPIPDHPKIYMMSDKTILSTAGNQSAKNMVYLNLHNNAIRNIEASMHS